MDRQQPNILHIVLDQLAPQFLPNYGHAGVKAPHIAALSQTGITFDAAYTNSPLCVPARASMVTGKLPSSVDIYDSGGELPATIPTLAHYLRACGYQTCLSGKGHFIGPDQLHGFEDRLTSDMCMADFGMSGDWERGEEALDFFHTMEAVATAGIAERAAQQDHDEEATYRAKQWLYDWARQPEEERRPFYLMYSLSQPHDPYVTPKRYWDRYDHDMIDMPAVPFVPLEQRDPYSQWLYRHYDRGEFTITDEAVRNARHAYYGNISYVDDLIGEILAIVERIGEKDNTIIVLCSDHGEMLGERGQWYKMSPYEPSARVPLVIHTPGMHEPRRSDAVVSLMDLAPTILDLASDGEALRLSHSIDPMEGNSLRALIAGEDLSWPDMATSELMFEGRPTPTIMVRQGTYKYVHIDESTALLFDIANDPQELQNLSGTPRHADMEKALADHVHNNWDFEALVQRMVRDQRRRNFIQRTHYIGKVVSWDYQPFVDASQQYYRSHMTWLEAEKRNKLEGPSS